MILDKQNMYSDSETVLTTAYSENYIDHGVARNLGVGRQLMLVIAVATAFTDSSSNSTMTATFETDGDLSSGDLASGNVQYTLTAFAALAAAGTQRVKKLGPGDINERYSQVKYTVANGDLTTGAFDAFLTPEIDQYTAYADNITIS